MTPVVLIVEDEASLVEVLRYNLECAGFEVVDTGSGEEALLIVEERRVDLVVLDWMLPHLSGIEVCRRLRRQPETRNLPIIMLTARSDHFDRIRGLDTGADDYIPKPVAPDELIARIRAVLRRTRPSLSAEKLTYGNIEMNLNEYKVFREGQPIHLGPTEFRLLRHFMENPGRVFSRDQLIDSVWGHGIFIDSRTVDVHIRRLRKALNASDKRDVIRTVRSAGYALDAEASVS